MSLLETARQAVADYVSDAVPAWADEETLENMARDYRGVLEELGEAEVEVADYDVLLERIVARYDPDLVGKAEIRWGVHIGSVSCDRLADPQQFNMPIPDDVQRSAEGIAQLLRPGGCYGRSDVRIVVVDPGALSRDLPQGSIRFDLPGLVTTQGQWVLDAVAGPILIHFDA
ncbi:hypothetical protein [Streptomyces noursei]|uniref:hypothetical protein n=1 Tax=Streptomyces noursei TaxID=1971 RepID=UPI0016756001|nr:hypothetical protein [Streptomyces noursei]MCZ1021107.1 hypothetical protein [Streptomyces noursei]MCZ1021138.1 hypothetical protein [Streptomyces noursei]MCZ1021467.1 hypothetical protein [Streptomyces noursei]GGX51456.1 hypothetical protein GCM10010341_86200 [Streptomyces noursei]